MPIYELFVLDLSSFSTGLPDEGPGGDVGGPGGALGGGPWTVTTTDDHWISITVDDSQNDFFNELDGDFGAGRSYGSQVIFETVTLNGVTYVGTNDPAFVPGEEQFIFTAYDISGDPAHPTVQMTGFHIGTDDDLSVVGPVMGAVFYGESPVPGTTYVFLDENSSLASNNEYADTICFCKGTHILTNDGERPVETLSVGDRIETRDHGMQKIRWIGSTRIMGHGEIAPIKISAGALGTNDAGEPLPRRDLFVSPQHRMLISDWRAELMFGEKSVLAAAKHLVNDKTIRAVETGEVEYFHILFDTHEVIFAEGAPSESFYPGQQGLGVLPEEAKEEIFALFPELKSDEATYADLAFSELKSFEGRALRRLN